MCLPTFVWSKTIKYRCIFRFHITDYVLNINQVTGTTENVKIYKVTLKRQMFV